MNTFCGSVETQSSELFSSIWALGRRIVIMVAIDLYTELRLLKINQGE
jgi:hypothetical protein